MGDTLSLFFRLGISLAVVIGIMAIAGRVLKKRGVGFASGRGGQRSMIDVIARRGLSRTSAIAIVRVPGKHLVVGITDNAVNVLSELDPEAVEVEEQAVPEAPRTAPIGVPQGPGTAWKTLLDTMRERTVRRR